jgi:hypothetical protein
MQCRGREYLRILYGPEYLQAELRALHHFDEIIGQSAALRQHLRVLQGGRSSRSAAP